MARVFYPRARSCIKNKSLITFPRNLINRFEGWLCGINRWLLLEKRTILSFFFFFQRGKIFLRARMNCSIIRREWGKGGSLLIRDCMICSCILSFSIYHTFTGCKEFFRNYMKRSFSCNMSYLLIMKKSFTYIHTFFYEKKACAFYAWLWSFRLKKFPTV